MARLSFGDCNTNTRKEEAPPDEAGLVSLGNATKDYAGSEARIVKFNQAQLRAKKKPRTGAARGFLEFPASE